MELEHRLYGLSNGVLQDRWPKVCKASGLCMAHQAVSIAFPIAISLQ